MRNFPEPLDVKIFNLLMKLSQRNELKENILLINDSTSKYSFLDKVFADNWSILNNFYDVNYLIDVPSFTGSNLDIIGKILKPKILVVFDIFNLKLFINNFPDSSFILVLDESDSNFESKLRYISDLKTTSPIFIVFCGTSIDKFDNAFDEYEILQYSRLSHVSDTLRHSQFIDFLYFLSGILLKRI